MINRVYFKASVWTRWVALAMLLGYGVFIGINHAPVAAGADSGGYLGSAQLLAQGRLTTTVRPVPEFNSANSWAQTPLGYQLIPGEKILRPTYPIGLPLHYALAGLLLGWHWGPLIVGVLGALAAVLLCYLCARELGVGPTLAFAGAASVAVSPLFLFSSFTPMSDVIATAWCSGAFLAALNSRRGHGWALGCGVAFSIAVLVRPANAILFPVLLIVLRDWRSFFRAGLGAMPAAVVNGIYNNHMWGSPFRSGYGSVAEAFSRSFFLPSLANYVETLPLALPLAFVGLFLLPFLPWKKHPCELSACLLWAGIFLTFYAFYEFTNTAWWFLRFIVPAFPALVILSVWGIEAVVERFPESKRRIGGFIIGILVVAASVAGSFKMAREKHFMLMKEYQEPYVKVCQWAKDNMPPNSLVACMQTSSAFFYYTNLPILRWDATDPIPFADLKSALKKSERSFYAVLLPFEVENAFKRLPGHWEKIVEFQSVGIWKFNPNP